MWRRVVAGHMRSRRQSTQSSGGARPSFLYSTASAVIVGVQPDVEQEHQRAGVDARLLAEPDHRLALPVHDQGRHAHGTHLQVRGAIDIHPLAVIHVLGFIPLESGVESRRGHADHFLLGYMLWCAGCCTWPCHRMGRRSSRGRATRRYGSGMPSQGPRAMMARASAAACSSPWARTSDRAMRRE